MMRLLCQGVDKPYDKLCELFNDETNQGTEMSKYTALLQKAVEEISTVFSKRVISKLKTGRDGILIPKEKQGSKTEHFELITWLIIK